MVEVRKVAYVAPDRLSDLELSIVTALQEIGIQTDLHIGSVDKKKYTSADTGLIVGPMKSHVRLIDQIPPNIPIKVWNTEQFPHYHLPNQLLKCGASLRFYLEKWIKKGHIPGGRLRMAGEMCMLSQRVNDFAMATYSLKNAQRFRMIEIPACPIPPGYFPNLGYDKKLDYQQRDIDVIFLGSTNNRRGKIIRSYRQQFADMGIRFEIYDGGNIGHPNVFGAERTELLNRSKVLLSLGRDRNDDHIFRLFLAGANNAAVVAENASVDCTLPFRCGTHFQMDRVNDIPQLVKSMLDRPHDVTQLAHNLQMTVMTMPLQQQINQLLQLSEYTREKQPVKSR